MYIVSIDGFIGPFETLLEAELAASAALVKHGESRLYRPHRRNVVVAEVVGDGTGWINGTGAKGWNLFKR